MVFVMAIEKDGLIRIGWQCLKCFIGILNLVFNARSLINRNNIKNRHVESNESSISFERDSIGQ